MRRTKQLVPWPTEEGKKPLVAAAYDAIRTICDAMIVVLGHEADAVAAALGDRPFHRVDSDPDADMFLSIRVGLDAAQQIAPHATVVLQPGDHPEVSRSTLESLTAWSLRRPGVAIMPEYQTRGGHPVLIPPTIARRLIETDEPGGLRRFWECHPELCLRRPVDDPGAVRDIDTSEHLDGR
jgi:molybdenum cofactor cytidylyltransferase